MRWRLGNEEEERRRKHEEEKTDDDTNLLFVVVFVGWLLPFFTFLEAGVHILCNNIFFFVLFFMYILYIKVHCVPLFFIFAIAAYFLS